MITHKHTVTACLDADSIAVRAAAVNKGGDPDDIINTCHHLIDSWARKAHADRTKVFISEGRCFRYDVFEDYKANRKDKPKPPGTNFALAYLKETFPQDDLHSNPLLEADDRLGYYATDPEAEDIRIIVSVDKDMEQIPTWVMNPDKFRFPVRYTMGECFKKQMEQWMRGDSIDGYKGLKTSGQLRQFGIKAFEKWWEGSLGGVWEEGRVLALFEEHGHTQEQALQQYLCATIKHHRLPEYAKSLSVKDMEALW